ncbi:MAG: substrate-binding domain-containing protein [Deltaproteobacteria bacterium]
MKHTTMNYLFALFAGIALSMPAWAADVVVIVNNANANAVDKSFVVKIYTGETKYWLDNSGPIFAIDQSEDNPIRADFYSSVLGKTSANMKALWAQNIFAGKGLPPKVVDPDAEVKKVVSTNKNAIGYIKASSVDDSVKAIKW